jgi:hypothetical protein
MYRDDHRGLPADTINQFYGVAEQQQAQVQHEAINMPDHANFFTNNESEVKFLMALHKVIDDDIVPAGYGVFCDEWEDGAYPSFETLCVGK